MGRCRAVLVVVLTIPAAAKALESIRGKPRQE